MCETNKMFASTTATRQGNIKERYLLCVAKKSPSNNVPTATPVTPPQQMTFPGHAAGDVR